MFRNSLPFFLFGFICLLVACGKEKINLIWTEQESNTSFDLTSVYFVDENRGYAVGGNNWYTGVLLETLDGGATWVVDSLCDKQLLSVSFDKDGNGFTTGIDGYLYDLANDNERWNFHRLPSWEIMRGVAFYDKMNGVLVGGEAFKNGAIQRISNYFQVDTLIQTDYDLSAVCFSDSSTVHAVGYGVVLRSIDGGYTWEQHPTIGNDFFKAIHFPNPETGYGVGFAGSIIKTTDAGDTWTKLRDGDDLLVRDKAFRSVFFVTENKGYIVGDSGIFWKTENGGTDWQIIDDFPKEHLYDIFVKNDQGWIVGKDGKVFHFED